MGKFVLILIYHLIGLCLVFSVSSAEEWTKEPTTFLGLKLDEPLIGQIPECPANTMCFKKKGSTTYLDKLPYLGIDNMYYMARVGEEVGNVDPGLSATIDFTKEGNVYKITLKAGRRNNSQLIDLARAKYGPPQERERTEENVMKQITPIEKTLYVNIRQREYWYGDRINIDLAYTIDRVPSCTEEYSRVFPGLFGVEMCEKSQAATLTAESTSNVKRNIQKEQEEQKRAIGNL